MGDAGRWWPRLSVAGVLAVLAVAVIAGMRPGTGVALAARTTAAPISATPGAAGAEPAPAAILAPIAARGAIASRGDIAYELVDSTLTLQDIPPQALAAYQRAAAVIDLADDRCHLDWELLAALGKVLTDHGRVGGSALDENGVPRPWVVGQRLTGRHATPRVPDTDSGTLDRDPRVDRAVGPMLLLPAVWSVVSVDGDGDGRRNPQDIDDAALAAAVLLCAGPGDLRHATQRRDEIRRFHGGSDYTMSVLAVRAAYLDAVVPAPAPVPILVRVAGGVAVSAPVAVPVPTPGDPTYIGTSTFAPGPSAAGSPTGTVTTPGVPSASPTGPTPSLAPTPFDGPSERPSRSPSQSPSQTPSGSQSPSASPSDCSSPSGSPSPAATPTECPTPTSTDLTPTSTPTADDDPSPTAAVAVPGVTLVPLAGWLWWRRRRPSDGEASPTV